MSDNQPNRVDPPGAIKNAPQVSLLLRPQRYRMLPRDDGRWNVIRIGPNGDEQVVGTMVDRETASTVALALDDKHYEDNLPHALPSNVTMYMAFQPEFDAPPRQYHGDWRDHVPQPIRDNWLNLSWSAKRAVLWMAHLKHLEDQELMAYVPPPAYEKET